MADLLPIGAYVRIGGRNDCRGIGRVVGYDMGRTKYELAVRYGGWGEWLFSDGGWWEFPAVVEEIAEGEALT